MHPIQAVAGFAEPISSWMHLLGAAAFLWVGARAVRLHCALPERLFSLLVFGIATVLQLALSGIYHMTELPSASRPVLQVLDHAAIFVLIAGTLTAVHGTLFAGAWRRRMIYTVWSLCALGVCLKAIYFAETPEWLGLATYFAMGLLGLTTTVKLWRRHGMRYTLPLLGGGLVYTLGALLDFRRAPVLVDGVLGPHELLHLAVLLALALHWRFVLRSIRLADEAANPASPAGDAAGPAMQPA